MSIRGILAIAVLGVASLSSSAALAAPPAITESFNSGNDGWHLYEGLDESEASWVGEGGNPGGFIRYSDPGASGYDAVFGDEDYVSGIARYRWDGMIVADMRSSVAGSAPRVYLGDASDYRAPRLSATAQPRLSGEWTRVEVPLKARLWRHADGGMVSPAEFGKFLRSDPVILWEAEYSDANGEVTDLDNVGIVVATPRTLKLGYSRRKERFQGTVSSDNQACESGTVRVLKKRPGKDRLIGSDDLNDKAKYAVEDPGKKGRYIAKIAFSEPEPNVACEKTRSKTLKLG